MADIKEQKLLYHLTALENIGSILDNGLLPRAMLEGFVDVADQEIIGNRGRLSLENFVPFHWFARNPFDGRVQESHPDREFVLIAVYRSLAAQRNWQVVPQHPLANTDIRLMNYAEGFEEIDWETMNERDYHNPYCKSVCMAECLSPEPVPPTYFQAIYVRTAEIKAHVESLTRNVGLDIWVNVSPAMFLT